MVKKKCIKTLLLVGLCIASIFILLRRFGPNEPRISIKQPVINMGVFECKSDPQTVKFEISNKGTSPLVIDKIIASCSCLEPKIEDDTLAPGKKTHLILNVSVPLTAGKWQEEVLVSSNDPKQRIIPLKVTAYVEARCNVEPGSINIQLHRGDSQKIELKVFGPTDDSSFRVAEVTCKNKNVHLLKIHEAELSETGKRCMVPIDILISNKGKGSWKDTLLISNSDTRMPILKVPIIFHEISDIVCKPHIISLFQDSAGQEVNGNFEISCRDQKYMIEPNDIESSDWIDVQIKQSEDGDKYKQNFFVHVNKEMTPGPHKGEVCIHLKDLGEPIKVPVLLFCKVAD